MHASQTLRAGKREEVSADTTPGARLVDASNSKTRHPPLRKHEIQTRLWVTCVGQRAHLVQCTRKTSTLRRAGASALCAQTDCSTCDSYLVIVRLQAGCSPCDS